VSLDLLFDEPELVEEAAYLRAELKRLDLLLHREILRLRAAYQLSLDEFRGLYVSDEQVDAHVDEHTDADDGICAHLTEQAMAMRWLNADRRPADGRWARVIGKFGLSDFEIDVLLLAIAPEVDLKYEQIYAYLNNDVTRKAPTVALALALFCDSPEEKLLQRRSLASGSLLQREGLLVPTMPRSDRTTGLAAPIVLAPAVVDFLLGGSPRPAELAPFAAWRQPRARLDELPLKSGVLSRLRNLPTLLSRPSPPIVALAGRRGVGREIAAEAVCAAMGRTLLRVDLAVLQTTDEPLDRLLKALRLQQHLEDIAFYLTPVDVWLDDEGKPLLESHAFIEGLAALNCPVFLAGSRDTLWSLLLHGTRHVLLRFEVPDAEERFALWREGLARHDAQLDDATLGALSERFALTAGEIAASVQAGLDAGNLGDGNDTPAFEVFADASRRQTGGDLDRLMQKVRLPFHWEDLVLPDPTVRQAQEVAAAIRHGPLVYGRWGFGRRAPAGRGLKVLFAGASGTGKTMAAGVIARQLGLDLYKIDLAGIVSKYIGETEKNLERIFRAAQDSQAILFFDEADALFGKRSEVKEAHDRYANVEVSYLLQRLEEHDGAVILASNLSKNIDEAFMRRMHYVVEFPLPDEGLRLRLWQGMFGPEAPLADEVDFAFLAKQFQLAGGEIKNVALDAAFLAADDTGSIEMKHLVRAMARQQMKRGRSPQAADFKQYYAYTS
jgi:SpoVK/Ycf46/Vps4 family AAA+-type ATPase